MNRHRPDQSRLDAIAKEHAAVRGMTRDLQADLDGLRSGPAGQAASRELLEHLRRFREHLVRHFRFEEEQGYLSHAEERDESARREIADLLEEHRRFERETEDLIVRLTGADELPPRFETEVRTLLARLAIHESKENALFRRADRQ